MKKWMILILLLAYLVPLAASAGEKSMGKIAVASDGKNIMEPVGFRMGQSSFYLLFDGQGRFLEAIDNPFKNAGGNAAGRSGKSAVDSLRFDEKGGLIGGVETLPKEEREKIWSSMLGFLTSKGVTVVVAEQFGYEIVRAMKEKGIACVEFKGSSTDAVKKAQQTVNETE
jgi:hypothetical protein